MFLGDSEQIYDIFFNSTSVETDVFELNGDDVYGSLNGDAYGAKNQNKPPQPEDITVTVSASLLDFYNSSMKTVKYMRDQINPDGRTII